MKDKLLKLFNSKNELRTNLALKAKTTEDIKELRSINSQIENINTELKELQGLINEAEEREKELKEREKQILESQTRKVPQSIGEYRAIAKMLKGQSLTEEERALVTLEDNNALLPEDFINQLQILRKGFPSLKKYCHVIPVNKKSGKMPFAIIGNNKLSKLTSGNAIPEGTTTTTEIKYDIEDYGKIIPVENSLTEDEVVGLIQNVINPDFAEASVLTENDEILAILKANSTEIVGATSYEDVEKTIAGVLPSLKAGIITITNVKGYVHLKTKKDKEGRPLNLVTNINGQDYYEGKPLVTLDDADLPASAEGKLVYYVVNLRALAKFFERKGYAIATSKEVLFSYNQTAIRVLERFDTVKGDARAAFKIEFNEVSA